MQGLLRSIVTYGLLIGIVWGLAVFVPRMARLRTMTLYDDIEGFDATQAVNADRTVGLAQLQRGDAVAFRQFKEGVKDDVYLGWVAALPGDVVQIENRRLVVNGTVCTLGGETARPYMGPLAIPGNRFFVVSSFHRFDSIELGPLPASALLGRLKVLP